MLKEWCDSNVAPLLGVDTTEIWGIRRVCRKMARVTQGRSLCIIFACVSIFLVVPL